MANGKQSANRTRVADAGRTAELSALRAGDNVPSWAVPLVHRRTSRCFGRCDWLVAGKVAGRVDVQCVHDYHPGRSCDERGSIGGGGRGFLGKQPVAQNLTKGLVYAALSRGGGPMTANEVAASAGVGYARAKATLDAGTRHKVAYVERSVERVATAVGMAYAYELAPRGWKWIGWAIERGLLQGENHGGAYEAIEADGGAE